MKGLFIGINYFGTACELRGCINDINTISQLYKKLYGLTNVLMLSDDQNRTDKLPTKYNILKGIEWLVSNNKPGEQLFFHYSGHGSYVTDTNGDEPDGKDECIIPCDYNTNGYIVDDELHIELVNKVKNAYLFAVMDNCHSGTALDLNYSYESDGSIKKITNNYTPYLGLNVVLLSGCADNQTSAVTTEKVNNRLINCGALSWALYYTLGMNPNITCKDLITEVRNLLAKSKYEQRPQLSFNVFPILTNKAIKGDKK